MNSAESVYGMAKVLFVSPAARGFRYSCSRCRIYGMLYDALLCGLLHCSDCTYDTWQWQREQETKTHSINEMAHHKLCPLYAFKLGAHSLREKYK